MKFKSILLATAATLGFSAHAMAQQWTTKAPMPAAVAASGVAVINNIIYVVGGSGSTSNLNSVYAYDPSTDSWSTKAQMSFIRGELSVAAVNGKIYAIGGYNNTNAVNIVEEYDPISNTWTNKAPMPTSRSTISCGVINNKIYVVGGWPGGLTTLEEYTPATNTWATKASFPFGIMSINTCQVLNNKLYYVGGKNSGGNVTTTNQAYDPISDTWTAYTALPQQRWAGATSELNGEIYFFGGTNIGNSTVANFTNNYIYNTFSNTWSNGLSMPRKRALQVAANVNGKIYLIGGVDSTGIILNLNEEYSVCSNNLTLTPQTTSLTTGNTATFTAATSDPNPSYIWQSNLGQGFQTLNNFGNYSGVNSATLNIANVQLSEHNQPIRVISTSGNCVDTSNIATISITDTCIVTINDTITTLISVTDTLIINTTVTGLTQPNNLNTIKVFPNPANDHITINYGNFASMSGYTLKITNNLGQVVFTSPINQQSSYIDLSTWTGNGIYFVQIIDPQNNTIENRKIVIQ
jgi:N-acetylneuraminic acid mutarotase